MDFDKNLGLYPVDNYQLWCGLSNYISEEVIKRIEAIGSNIILSEEQERKFRIEEEE